eukprot:g9360.t1
MSKWLLGSGGRSPTSARAAGALKTPPRQGRRATEETVDGDASRRSSQQSQADELVIVEGAGAMGGADPDSDWEIVHHTSALEGFCGDGAGDERPLSPGVDFTKGPVAEVEPGAPDGGKGKDTCKWQDAANIHSFLVRGPTYLQDKAKLPAGTAMCRLVGFDCFSEGSEGTTRIDHIASRGACRERVEAMTSGDDAPFLFIMNIQVRGTPPLSMVAYWAVNRQGLQAATVANSGTDTANSGSAANGDGCGGGGGVDGADGPLDVSGKEEEGEEERRASQQERVFLSIVASYANIPVSSFGGDGCTMMDDAPPPPYSDERNARFKLIPRVIGGPWMVRKAVGSTPVLLGTKITHRYYRGERYVETDMDTGSSAAAASLCGRCRGLSRKIDVELGIVLQANSAQELPEALLGAVRLKGFGVEDPTLQTKLFPSGDEHRRYLRETKPAESTL